MKNHIADGFAQAVICNSGNANTCNANGIEIAEGMSKPQAVASAAKMFKISEKEIWRHGGF